MSTEASKISRVTIHLSIASFLMQFSTTAVILTSLSIFPKVSVLIFVKTLSKCFGYVAKFVIGLTTDLWGCNTAVLKIGYGSNFILKPMFYLSCFGVENLVSVLGLDSMWHYSSEQTVNINMTLFAIADATDQMCNNLRDVARDTLISNSVHPSALSRNLSLRKSASVLGIFVGGMFALLCRIYINSHSLHIVMMCALATSTIGYGFLWKVLGNQGSLVASKMESVDHLRDSRFLTIVACALGSLIFMVYSYFPLYLMIAIVVCVGSYALPSFYSLPLCNNRRFMMLSIVMLLMSCFQIDRFVILEVFDLPKILPWTMNWNSDIVRQVFFLCCYFISFLSSFIASNFKFRSTAWVVWGCAFLSFIMYFSAALFQHTVWGFVVSTLFYGIHAGVADALLNAGAIKTSSGFKFRGLTLGFFSLFASVGIMTSAFLIRTIDLRHILVRVGAIFYLCIICVIWTYKLLSARQKHTFLQ